VENKIKTTTLKELGSNLCLGTPKDGGYVKPVRVKKWRMKEERELGELKDHNKESSIAQFVSVVLATMAEQVGHRDFTNPDMKREEKQLHISQMWMPDVFQAYLLLRISAMGNKLALNLTCPYNKKHEFPYDANLLSTDVRTCDTLEDALWDYDLIDPFEIRGKTLKGFRFGPARWTTLESMSDVGSMNTGAAKAGIILGSIHGLIYDTGEVEALPLAMHEIDDMCKPDIEGITASLDDHAIGPEMAVDAVCPTCNKSFKVPIDWSYDGFFGNSSR